MSERIECLLGERFQSVEIEEDPDQEPGDYMAYRITIRTDQRTLTIRGCHDMGPELTETPASE